MSDPVEFFAEMTESYFGHNDFFPFKQEEPEIYDMLTKIWGTSPTR